MTRPRILKTKNKLDNEKAPAVDSDKNTEETNSAIGPLDPESEAKAVNFDKNTTIETTEETHNDLGKAAPDPESEAKAVNSDKNTTIETTEETNNDKGQAAHDPESEAQALNSDKNTTIETNEEGSDTCKK